jgi:hypothetical protein
MERSSCEECGVVWKRITPVRRRRQSDFQILDALIGDGDLGVDDRIDHEHVLATDTCEGLARPSEPPLVLGRDVKEDV